MHHHPTDANPRAAKHPVRHGEPPDQGPVLIVAGHWPHAGMSTFNQGTVVIMKVLKDCRIIWIVDLRPPDTAVQRGWVHN
jgi:hypothetical protein